MSIEQKIAAILAESKSKKVVSEEVKEMGSQGGPNNKVREHESGHEESHLKGFTDGVTKIEDGTEEETNFRNSEQEQNEGEEGTQDHSGDNQVNKHAERGDQKPIRNKNTVRVEDEEEAGHDDEKQSIHKAINIPMKEDIDAMLAGAELTEEFKTKAATIFEAAVLARVKAATAVIEESYAEQLAEEVESIKEGLVEKVDGYLGYIVEQWVQENELALESGMKSEIMESFIEGMKSVFAEHYIEVPEEKFDVLADLQEQLSEVAAKLDEQLEANVGLTKVVNEQKRVTAIAEAADGLTDTEVEKFAALAEELSYEDLDTYATKLQTIRENYFGKSKAAVSTVKSAVTDTPVEQLTEEAPIDPSVKKYLSVLDKFKQ